jgi:uncharacterized protein YhfF
VSFELTWEPDPVEIPARACDCTFCVKHGGVWTSNPKGALRVKIEDPAEISPYLFGTRTATFHVCRRCGVPPLVTSEIEGRVYAVVNVTPFDAAARAKLKPSGRAWAAASVTGSPTWSSRAAEAAAMYDVGPALLGKLAAAGIHLPEGSVSVGSFGDSPELSEELLALIRIGRKRGGASLLWAWEADGETLPCMGHREVVLDHRGEPVFVTRVTEVQVVPFDRVGADFAAREGEGDGSLAYWRRAHEAFFARECQRIARQPAPDMPVVCISFEVEHMLPR